MIPIAAKGGMAGLLGAVFLFCGTAGAAEPGGNARSSVAAGSPFEIHPALEIQLVAAEPLLASPVAIAFDEAARLYVVEMLDYPDQRDQALGRVVVLEDTDGDGRFDRRTVFADKIAWPTGVICSQGGVFVTSTPDLIYLKDTDGDGSADLRQVVATGFGSSVPQPAGDMVVNGFAWGLDNRIYGSTAPNGGRVTKPGADGAPLDLRGRDFSIDPVAMTLRPESGVAQFGISFDDFGRRFASTNSRHLLLVMYDQRYATKNPYFDLPRPMLDIPADGPAAEVFRSSAEEEWRVVRTQWRVAGKAVGMIEGGGRASGYFTSSCGVTIYRGDALPAAFYGNVFVAEPAGNLVHRKLLSPDGVALVGRRAPEEQKTEVLRSSDPLFRPVNFANGPDGALYVVDMHRQVVEVASGIPEEIRRKTQIYGGRDTGRIYRIAAKGRGPQKLPALAGAPTAQWVAQLENHNVWMRETAARLLFERQDRSVVPALEALAQHSTQPYARLQALSALDGLQALQPRHVLQALADREAGVRENGLKLAEPFLGAEPVRTIGDQDRRRLRARVLQLADDPAPRVRYQLALTISELSEGDDANDALFRIASTSIGDRWLTAASLNAMNDNAVALFQRVTANRAFIGTPEGLDFLGQMLGIIGARAKAEETATAITFLGQTGPADRQMKLVNAFHGGLKRAGRSLQEVDPEKKLTGVLRAAAGWARDSALPEATRIAALRLAAENSGLEDAVLYQLLRPTEPQGVQLEAVAVLGGRPSSELAMELTNRWNEFTARVRQEALRLLIAQPARMLVLLEAIQGQKIRRSDLSPSQIQTLRNHPDEQVRQSAQSVFEATAGNRQKVIDRYLPALSLSPDPAHGRQVFRANCVACHRLEGEGFELGPNLLGVKNRGKEGVLIDILDPNRKVDPSYLFYEITTQKGEIVMGAIADETPSSITVKQPQGDRTAILRTNIKAMKAGTQSLMPDGLESAINPQDMADLLEYIMQAR